jgi:hypothetical protein
MITKSPIELKQWKVITANYTAKIGDRLFIDISTSGQIITMPTNPPLSGTVEFIRIVTSPPIGFNFGSKPFGASINTGIFYAEDKYDALVYINATIGWVSLNKLIHV